MGGRFTLTWEEWRRVAEALKVDDDCDVAANYRPRFNIAPTDHHFIVTSEFERRRVQRARWGLVNRRATDNRRASQCINAKAETLEHDWYNSGTTLLAVVGNCAIRFFGTRRARLSAAKGGSPKW